MAEVAGSRIRILVVDDDELAVAVIASVLEAASIQTFTMLSPIGATRAITENDVHVVVVDVNMPTLRGDRIVSLLHGWERTKELPVVLVSGSADTLSQVKTALPGVETLTKDRLATDLVPLVRRLAASRRTAPERSPASASNSLGQAFQTECLALVQWHDRTRDQCASASDQAELARRLSQLADEAALLGYSQLADVASRFRSTLLARSGREASSVERAEDRKVLEAFRKFATDPSASETRALHELARAFGSTGRPR